MNNNLKEAKDEQNFEKCHQKIIEKDNDMTNKCKEELDFIIEELSEVQSSWSNFKKIENYYKYNPENLNKTFLNVQIKNFTNAIFTSINKNATSKTPFAARFSEGKYELSRVNAQCVDEIAQDYRKEIDSRIEAHIEELTDANNNVKANFETFSKNVTHRKRDLNSLFTELIDKVRIKVLFQISST